MENLLKEIQKNSDIARWNRGVKYYKSDFIENVQCGTKEQYAMLAGMASDYFSNDIFYPKIILNIEELKINKTVCTCNDYKAHTNENKIFMCKHLIATFLSGYKTLEHKLKISKILKEKNKKLTPQQTILKYFRESNSKQKINLEVYLVRAKSKQYEVSFKIGNDKMYVLKNLEEFVKARLSNEPIKYGKEFTYNPLTNYFSDKDLPIIEFIEQYVSLNTHTQTISGKNITILPSNLKRFLLSTKEKTIDFNYKNQSLKLKVKREDVPLSFSLNENEEEFILSVEGMLPSILNEQGDVIFYNNNLYLPSEKQYSNYRLFYQYMRKTNEMRFEKENAKELLNNVLPNLEKIYKEVEIQESLRKKIKRDFDVKFYFDKDRKKIWCDLKYEYEGEVEDTYIVRDHKKDLEIEKTFEMLDFYREQDKFIFEGDDESLYTFLTNTMSSIKNLGQVYYSDKFKEQKIHQNINIDANIKSNKGYFDFTFNIDDINPSEYQNILDAFKSNKKFYKLKDESFVNLEDKDLKDFLDLLDNINLNNNLENGNMTFHNSKAFYMEENIKSHNINFIKGRNTINEICEKFKEVDQIDYEIPKNLNAKLRDYQVSGFKWLKTLNHYGFGGILADEMGLGKTIQIITFLLSEQNKKSILITPTSLIYNWKSEFENFAKDLKVLIIHGNKAERSDMLKNIDDYDIVLTTYATLRNDYDEYKNKKFDYCIIDEAQNIKNSTALNSEVVKEINANIKFALTGTPIENNLLELWSIFDYILPGYLLSANKFKKEFIKNEESLDKLKQLIKPFILRRLKKDVVSELPQKIEKNFFVEMYKEQKEVYTSLINDIKEKMQDKEFRKNKITIFSYLTKLRQLCLDPSIIMNDYNGESSKVDVLLDLVKDNVKENHKILVFSQFTSVLKKISNKLDDKNINHLYLDGSVRAQDRIHLVNEFNENEDVSVFLISLKAGGTGLNLTSADIVIHFDPWWNPAIENQATDRAHRIGQQNVVQVIKMISTGTIEEKIVKLQQAKKELIENVISEEFENSNLLTSLNEEELIQLFS